MHTDRATAKSIEHDFQQIAEGIAREVVKFLQKLKKNSLAIKVAPAQTQKLNIAVEPAAPTSELNTATAHTATQLLHQYGQQEGQETVYKAEGYTLRANQEDTVIENRQGELLMKFKAGQDPQIQQTQMGNRELRDFARVQEQIQLYGVAQMPEDRLRQYQNLTPAQDVTHAGDVRNLAAVISAQRVLSATGKDTHENDQYRFSQQGETLTILAKDGRGEIAQLQDGQVTANLSARDTVQLNQLERQVTRPEVQAQTEDLNLTPLEAVVYDRLMSTSSFSPGDAKVLAEQAVKPSLASDPDLRTMVFSKEEAIARSGQNANQAKSVEPPRQVERDQETEYGD